MKFRIKEITYVYSDTNEIKSIKYFIPQYKKFLLWHNFTQGWGDSTVDFKNIEGAEQYLQSVRNHSNINTKPVYHEVKDEI